MRAAAMSRSTSTLPQFCSNFRRLVENEDAAGVCAALCAGKCSLPEKELPEEASADSVEQMGGEHGDFLRVYLLSLRARATGNTVRELELACACLKTWAQRYIDTEGSGLWMTPAFIELCSRARGVAVLLDETKRSESSTSAYLKRLVEIHRELFQKLNKERTKRAGYVWVCCELLRAYFRLGQVSQCSFLLTAVSQSLAKDGFNPCDLPKAIGVTFFFYWGKHCVFDNSLRDADEKLTWAFSHAPPKAISQRRKILLYLVPCRLRLGVLPTEELLTKYKLDLFVDIVRAIREGNQQLFTERMEEYAADFIKMGTYLLMMRLKFTVYRSLCKGVHQEVRRQMGDKAASKLDLAPFEKVFAWQDGCDADETACVLSNLIHQGAVKGYLSHEHRKLVFAKDLPFPPPTKWRI